MDASAHLKELAAALRGPVALGELLGRMQRSGFGLVLLFLSVPFLQPLPTAGLSTPLGLVLLLLGLQLMRRRRAVWIPGFLASRVVDVRLGRKALDGAGRALQFAERFFSPRLCWLAGSHRLVGFMVAVMAATLMLPIPVPLSNVVCAVPICLFGLAILTRDGLAAALAMAASALGLAYHAAIFTLGAAALGRLWGIPL